MSSVEPTLFDPPQSGPDGFKLQNQLLTREGAADLQERLAALEFQPFEFRGFLGKRRVIYFGWRYDFTHGRLERAAPIPSFLDDVPRAAAAFAGLDVDRLEQVLINAYAAGAGIGWHKDRPQFEDVIGVSIGSAAVMRFRQRQGTRWRRIAVPLAARSAYLLRGPARELWEHSLPEAEATRYSITFRTLRAPAHG